MPARVKMAMVVRAPEPAVPATSPVVLVLEFEGARVAVSRGADRALLGEVFAALSAVSR